MLTRVSSFFDSRCCPNTAQQCFVCVIFTLNEDVQCNSARQSLFHYPACAMKTEQGSREPEAETARLQSKSCTFWGVLAAAVASLRRAKLNSGAIKCSLKVSLWLYTTWTTADELYFMHGPFTLHSVYSNKKWCALYNIVITTHNYSVDYAN